MDFECPRCHKRSLPEQETGYYDSGLCSECEEILNEQESDREDPEDRIDFWDRQEEME